MIESKDPPYNGPDSRKGPRRKKNDRREIIRFEVNKEDRRKNSGKRKDDGDIWQQR